MLTFTEQSAQPSEIVIKYAIKKRHDPDPSLSCNRSSHFVAFSCRVLFYFIVCIDIVDRIVCSISKILKYTVGQEFCRFYDVCRCVLIFLAQRNQEEGQVSREVQFWKCFNYKWHIGVLLSSNLCIISFLKYIVSKVWILILIFSNSRLTIQFTMT